ncbi:PQQ-binding-like beta-propeller repeat protein [candidate division KSB1 bacterium]|nr:PQQ-binding-like beta-propeller repeat protein [candidate division KSB1 bacterium]
MVTPKKIIWLSWLSLMLFCGYAPAFSQDWPFFRHDPQHQAHDTTTTDTLGDQIAWTFQTGGAIFSSPVVGQHRVYFAATDNYLYCLVDSTGALVWKTQLGNWIEATPALVHGKLYVGCMDHRLYAIDAVSGQILWTFLAAAWIESSPIVVDGRVYFGGTDHHFYCVDAETGALCWKYQVGRDIYSSPAYWNGMVFFGADDNRFYALDSTGQLRWRYETGGFSIAASPTITDSLVIFGTIDNGAIFDSKADTVINSTQNQLIALDALSGDLKWQLLVEPFGLNHSSPAVASGKVYAVTDQGIVRALNPKDGTRIWQTVVPDSGLVWSSPAIAAGVVYVGTYSGNLYLFSADSGHVLGSFNLGVADFIHASPAITRNFLYFGTRSGKFYAFGKVGVSVVAPELTAKPVKPELFPNYPNPFNLRTTIRYQLLISDRVAIQIFNPAGQLVRTLINTPQLAGTHTINWDGCDDRGKVVASGVYHFRIQAGQYELTRRMVLLK